MDTDLPPVMPTGKLRSIKTVEGDHCPCKEILQEKKPQHKALEGPWIQCYHIAYDHRIFWVTASHYLLRSSKDWWTCQQTYVQFARTVHFGGSQDVYWCFVLRVLKRETRLTKPDKICLIALSFWANMAIGHSSRLPPLLAPVMIAEKRKLFLFFLYFCLSSTSKPPCQ